MKHFLYSFVPEWLFYWWVRRKLYRSWCKTMKPRADALIEGYRQELRDIKCELRSKS